MTNFLYRGKKDVKNFMVQMYLQVHGYYLGYKQDGVFGQYTESELKRFQKDHGLVVDGGVGCQTWPVLVYPPCPPEWNCPGCSVASTPKPAPSSGTGCKVTQRMKVIKQEMNQVTRRTCGPASIVEALFEWGLTLDIDEVANYVKTAPGYAGTAPSAILEGVPKLTKKYGIPCKAYLKNHTELGGYVGLGDLLEDPNRTAILHIAYNANECNHYHAPMKVCFNSSLITIAENLHGQYEIFSFDDYLKRYIRRCSQKSYIIFEKI